MLQVLSLVAALTPSLYPASKVYKAQLDIIEHMRELYPAVEATVMWEPCDEENSYYQPADHTIHLCTEMEAHPGAAVFFAAHEMAHAVMDQITDVSSEQDADEVGALAMIKFGYQKELRDAAAFHKAQTDQDHDPGDPHPGNAFRSWELSCIEQGSEWDITDIVQTGPSIECRDLYQGLRVRWNTRLRKP